LQVHLDGEWCASGIQRELRARGFPKASRFRVVAAGDEKPERESGKAA
jgi:hypothetical protein